MSFWETCSNKKRPTNSTGIKRNVKRIETTIKRTNCTKSDPIVCASVGASDVRIGGCVPDKKTDDAGVTYKTNTSENTKKKVVIMLDLNQFHLYFFASAFRTKTATYTNAKTGIEFMNAPFRSSNAEKKISEKISCAMPPTIIG